MTLKKWDHYTDVPLFILSAVFLFAYSWEVLAGTYTALCNYVIDAIWAIYAIDYAVSLYLAPNRREWFKKNLLLLATIALPIFRPLRLLRLVAMLQFFNHGTGIAARGRITLYASSMVAVLIYVGALAEYAAEHNAPGAKITTFPLAVWWAFVTIATVGYGDFYPVTAMGRLIAIILMLAGIALIGIVTAMIASWIIDQVNRESVTLAQDETQATTAESRLLQGQMLQLSDSVSTLNNEIVKLRHATKKYQKSKKRHKDHAGHSNFGTEPDQQSAVTESIPPVHVPSGASSGAASARRTRSAAAVRSAQPGRSGIARPGGAGRMAGGARGAGSASGHAFSVPDSHGAGAFHPAPVFHGAATYVNAQAQMHGEPHAALHAAYPAAGSHGVGYPGAHGGAQSVASNAVPEGTGAAAQYLAPQYGTQGAAPRKRCRPVQQHYTSPRRKGK